MFEPQPDYKEEYNPLTDPKRMVWVVSKLQVEEGFPESEFIYKERFRSNWLSIPPNGKKRLLMHYLAAKKFLGQAVIPQQALPNGSFVNPDTGEVEKWRFGKPLEILELTDEERQEYEGLSPAQAMNRAKETADELANKKHTREGQEAIAVGTGKPKAQRTKAKSRPPEIPQEEIQRIDTP